MKSRNLKYHTNEHQRYRLVLFHARRNPGCFLPRLVHISRGFVIMTLTCSHEPVDQFLEPIARTELTCSHEPVDQFLEPIARTENPSISSWSRSHERKTRRSVPGADHTNGQVCRSVPEPDRTDGHELCDSNSVSSCHCEVIALMSREKG